MDDYKTVKEAVEITGLAEASIKERIQRGEIRAYKAGSTWVIPVSEIDKIKRKSTGRKAYLEICSSCNQPIRGKKE